MNKKEYNNYKKSVNDFLNNEGINNLSQITDNDGDCEPYFSNTSCDCCNRSWGGNRYDCEGYNPKTKEIYNYSICTDCVYFYEYGKLDVYDEISSSYFDELEIKHKNKTIKVIRKNNNESNSVDLKKCAKEFPELYLQLFNNKLIRNSKYRTIKIIK